MRGGLAQLHLLVFPYYASMIFNTSTSGKSFMHITRLHGYPYRAVRGDGPYPRAAAVPGFGTVWVFFTLSCGFIFGNLDRINKQELFQGQHIVLFEGGNRKGSRTQLLLCFKQMKPDQPELY